MVYQRISLDKKQRALRLLDLGWEVPEVAAVFGHSSRSIERWLDNYAQYGSITRTSVLRGRPRILNTEATTQLYALVAESPSLYLQEIQEWLILFHDEKISKSALDRNLKQLGLTRKVLRKLANEKDEVAKAAWLYDTLSHFTAEQMVFLDESSKDNRTLVRKYGRAPSGARAVELSSFQRGVRYSLLPALALDGYLAARVVEGSVDGAEFYDFVVTDVVRILRPETSSSSTRNLAAQYESLPPTTQYTNPRQL
jgi:transposase